MIITDIGHGQWLDAPAAASYLRAEAIGAPGGVTEAGRTRARQEYIYNTWNAQKNWPLAAREFKGYAAVPGTSKHEGGRALDLSGNAQTWFRIHGAEYGWTKDRVNKEPWHFEYESWNDKHYAETVANAISTTPTISPVVTITPINPLNPLEDDMLSDVNMLYKALVGREMGPDELLARITDYAGATLVQIRENLLDALAEPSAIEKAYSDYLGHSAGDAGVASKAGLTIRQVRAACRNAPPER
jgi:hypothetical protein